MRGETHCKTRHLARHLGCREGSTSTVQGTFMRFSFHSFMAVLRVGDMTCKAHLERRPSEARGGRSFHPSSGGACCTFWRVSAEAWENPAAAGGRVLVLVDAGLTPEID